MSSLVLPKLALERVGPPSQLSGPGTDAQLGSPTSRLGAVASPRVPSTWESEMSEVRRRTREFIAEREQEFWREIGLRAESLLSERVAALKEEIHDKNNMVQTELLSDEVLRRKARRDIAHHVTLALNRKQLYEWPEAKIMEQMTCLVRMEQREKLGLSTSPIKSARTNKKEDERFNLVNKAIDARRVKPWNILVEGKTNAPWPAPPQTAREPIQNPHHSP
ncbi:hypothetical protein CYMTET_44889, partial [Cymbomonas tetramitiformis]